MPHENRSAAGLLAMRSLLRDVMLRRTKKQVGTGLRTRVLPRCRSSCILPRILRRVSRQLGSRDHTSCILRLKKDPSNSPGVSMHYPRGELFLVMWEYSSVLMTRMGMSVSVQMYECDISF